MYIGALICDRATRARHRWRVGNSRIYIGYVWHRHSLQSMSKPRSLWCYRTFCASHYSLPRAMPRNLLSFSDHVKPQCLLEVSNSTTIMALPWQFGNTTNITPRPCWEAQRIVTQYRKSLPPFNLPRRCNADVDHMCSKTETIIF